MQEAIYLKATVLPEGKIEIEDTGLQEGESVDVIVMRSEKRPRGGQSSTSSKTNPDSPSLRAPPT